MKTMNMIQSLSFLALLILMTACNGGGGSSASNEPTDPVSFNDGGESEFLTLTFADPMDDHTGSNLFHFDGLDLSKPQAQMMDYDLEREMQVPSFIEVVADPNGQITQGLVAKLSLTGNLICHYNYNINMFEFDYCVGTYSNPTAGDKIKLQDLLDGVVTEANIDIEFDSTVVTNVGGIQLRADF